MSVIFTLETTGISQEDAEEILREFHQTIVSHAQSLGTGSTIVIKGLRFQRIGEPQMSPINLLRSSSFFSQDSYCGESIMTNLDVQIIAETLREILVYHHALGGGWIKIVAQEPFQKGAGWLLYESSPSLVGNLVSSQSHRLRWDFSLFSLYGEHTPYLLFSMAKIFLPYAYLRGEFLPFQDAHISIATHALHYGTAAFGGIRVAITDEGNALFFRLDDHARRLSRSAHYLGYEIAPEFIRSRLVEFVQMNKPKTSIYIRPLVYTSDLDISPRLHNIEKDFLIYGIELGDYLSADGVSATISSWVRQSDASFPLRAKISGGYITSALAKSEAVERGFDEALMMNSAGKLSEGSGMNVFLVRDGVIITPGVTEDILEGITRSSVIALARHLGYEVIERSVDKSELFIADEVFLTGTAARITPIHKIEQYHLPSDRPVFSAIKSYMATIFNGEVTPFSDWIEEIRF